MDTQDIVGAMESERDRLNRAIEILKPGQGGPRLVRDGRNGRRQMTEAGKRSISRQMKKRWAERKKAGKNSLAA